jgi:hypothetical protein
MNSEIELTHGWRLALIILCTVLAAAGFVWSLSW